jgi:hypothetical protein
MPRNAGAASAAPSQAPEELNGTTASVNEVPQTPAPAAPVAGTEGMVMAMMSQFMTMMQQSQADMRREMDERMERLVSSLRPERLTAEQRPAMSVNDAEPEMAQQYDAQGTLIAPPRGQRTQLGGSHTVAFIPKEDSLNPRQTVFRAWLNGREVRIRRGQVGMLSRGFAVDLARNRHGHVVDIQAMQGGQGGGEIEVQTYRDFSLPDSWDGRPLTRENTFTPTR